MTEPNPNLTAATSTTGAISANKEKRDQFVTSVNYSSVEDKNGVCLTCLYNSNVQVQVRVLTGTDDQLNP